MKTGCQGPFCHGTGGWCGCNCKCCPPPCCPVIAVYFQCGAPYSPSNPAGCVFPTPMAPWAELDLPLPIPELPKFSHKPIISEDSKFMFGSGPIPCSVPCETICVELRCGGMGMPCCCLELLNGRILSVGNGYVTAPSTVTIPGRCDIADVYINGLPPPVFVLDCEEIVVTVVPRDTTCCQCQQINVACAPCPITTFALKPLWKRKIDSRTGKSKYDPRTGKPLLRINKNELMRRVLSRIKKSRGDK